MVAHQWLGYRQGLDQVAHAQLLLGQELDYAPAQWLRQHLQQSWSRNHL